MKLLVALTLLISCNAFANSKVGNLGIQPVSGFAETTEAKWRIVAIQNEHVCLETLIWNGTQWSSKVEWMHQSLLPVSFGFRLKTENFEIGIWY